MKGKKQFPLSGMGISLLVILLTFSGYTAAKYVRSQKEEPLYVAKSFYFESDLLEAPASNGEIPKYTLQDGESTIAFQLKNYPDDLRTSEVDITYTVKLTTTDGMAVTDQIDKEGTLGSNAQTAIPVSFTGLSAGSYLVTAVATDPYISTLQAEFTIEGLSMDINSSVRDGAGSPNLMVTVTTTDYEGHITISWPDGVLPDNTDPLLETVSGNSCTVNMKKHSEYTFQFFKTNTKEDYTNKITVTKTNS